MGNADCMLKVCKHYESVHLSDALKLILDAFPPLFSTQTLNAVDNSYIAELLIFSGVNELCLLEVV